jgi:hypothetical protein
MTYPNWKLSVEDYGPIVKGQVELSSLVVLLGVNNSGKSYIASLLWALLNPGRSLFPNTPTQNASYRRCQELARSIRSGEITTIDDNKWKILADWISALVRSRSEEMAREVLACSEIVLKKASIAWQSFPSSLKVNILSVEIPPDRPARQRRVRRPPVITRWADEGLQFVIREDAADAAGSIEYYIVRTLADRLLRGLHPSWASYIPAARTGLMLGYKVFISGLLQNLEAESGGLARPVLPRPIVDFLQTLNVGTFLFDEDDDNEVISTASDLEAAILGGGSGYGE